MTLNSVVKRLFRKSNSSSSSNSDMAVIYIVIHSLWGHQVKLAEAAKKGLDAIPGVVSKIFQVAETLPQEVLTKMHAAKFDYPVIAADDLIKADGFILGLDTRFGNVCAQQKAFWDSTGQLWVKGELRNKFGACMVSTGSQKGGTETTIFSMLSTFSHHGVIYVPFGPQAEHASFDEIIGGSAWGAGTHSKSDGSRQVSPLELTLAERQGKEFAAVVSAYVAGKASVPN